MFVGEVDGWMDGWKECIKIGVKEVGSLYFIGG